jgi:hypothetical protein
MMAGLGCLPENFAGVKQSLLARCDVIVRTVLLINWAVSRIAVGMGWKAEAFICRSETRGPVAHLWPKAGWNETCACVFLHRRACLFIAKNPKPRINKISKKKGEKR